MKNGVECYKDFFGYFNALKTNCVEIRISSPHYIFHFDCIIKHRHYNLHFTAYLFNFQAFVDKIRKSVDEYPRLFVFAVDNMRNTHFQQVRDSWKTHSTFFLGKNRVMALALGRTENEEYSDKVSTFTILRKKRANFLFPLLFLSSCLISHSTKY